MGTKINPGEFDCMAKALPNEPFFILLARDSAAAGLVREWAGHRRGLIEGGVRPREDIRKVHEAQRLAAQMDAWREDPDNIAALRHQKATRSHADKLAEKMASITATSSEEHDKGVLKSMLADVLGVDVDQIEEVGDGAYAVSIGRPGFDGGEIPKPGSPAGPRKPSFGFDVCNDPDTFGKPAGDASGAGSAGFGAGMSPGEEVVDALQQMIHNGARDAIKVACDKDPSSPLREFIWPECLKGPGLRVAAHFGALALFVHNTAKASEVKKRDGALIALHMARKAALDALARV